MVTGFLSSAMHVSFQCRQWDTVQIDLESPDDSYPGEGEVSSDITRFHCLSSVMVPNLRPFHCRSRRKRLKFARWSRSDSVYETSMLCGLIAWKLRQEPASS